MAVGVFSVHIYHDETDINETVLAIDDQDAFAFLDDKYKSQVRVITGGPSMATTNQITDKALKRIESIKSLNADLAENIDNKLQE